MCFFRPYLEGVTVRAWEGGAPRTVTFVRGGVKCKSSNAIGRHCKSTTTKKYTSKCVHPANAGVHGTIRFRNTIRRANRIPYSMYMKALASSSIIAHTIQYLHGIQFGDRVELGV